MAMTDCICEVCALANRGNLRLSTAENQIAASRCALLAMTVFLWRRLKDKRRRLCPEPGRLDVARLGYLRILLMQDASRRRLNPKRGITRSDQAECYEALPE
jgi:hypothetical protein